MNQTISLRLLAKQIRQHIKPNLDFRLARKTALKYTASVEVTDLDGNEDLEITGFDALRILKIFAKAHNVDIGASPLASYLRYEKSTPNSQPEKKIPDLQDKLALGHNNPVEKPGYSEWVSYFGQDEILCPDFHKDEWGCIDWYAQYQYLFKQNLTASELVGVIKSCHPDNIGLLKAAVLAWTQTQPADGYFAEACIMAKNTKLVNLENQMYQSYWQADFEFFITATLAVIHLESFIKSDQNESPAFVDVIVTKDNNELIRCTGTGTKTDKIRDLNLIPKKPAKPVTFSVKDKFETGNPFYKSKQSSTYSEHFKSHNTQN